MPAGRFNFQTTMLIFQNSCWGTDFFTKIHLPQTTARLCGEIGSQCDRLIYKLFPSECEQHHRLKQNFIEKSASVPDRHRGALF